MTRTTCLALFFAAALVGLTACHHQTLEDRAAQEAADYTKRYCPTPIINNMRTDSMTFTRGDLTFHYYYTLSGKIDNDTIIKQHKRELMAALKKEFDADTKSKVYKDAGYHFDYVYRSQQTGKTLLRALFPTKAPGKKK